MRGETRQPAGQAGWETLRPAGASPAANRRLLSKPNAAFPAADFQLFRQLIVSSAVSCGAPLVVGFEKIFSLKAVTP